MLEKRWRSLLVSFLVVNTYCVPSWSAASAPRYQIRSLNTSAFPGAINNSGEAVLSMPPEGTTQYVDDAQGLVFQLVEPGRALLWNGSAIESLINLGSDQNWVSDLNDDGLAVGTAAPLIDGKTKAILFGPGPQATVLDISPGFSTNAVAIDASGTRIVGTTTFDPEELPRAFLYEVGIGTLDLGNLGAGTSIAVDISDSGSLIVGVSQTGATTDEVLAGAAFEEAFLYKNGIMTGLGTLGGHSSAALGVSNSGIVVGESARTIGGPTYAFILDELNGMRQIATAGTTSIARAVNNSGLVVGRYRDDLNNNVAFIYDTDEGTADLFDLLINPNEWANLSSAVAINDRGEILGRGVFQGELTAYIASPVAIPEPISLALDIKPGSDGNPVNLKSRGVLPMAVLSTDDFNASDIDVETLLFGDPLLLDDGGTAVSPLRFALEDVSDDGLVDLTLKFSLPDLVGFGALGPDTIEGLLTGTLFDGTPIEAADSMRIVPPNGTHVNSLQTNAIPEPSSFLLAAALLALLSTTAARLGRPLPR